MNIKLTIIKDFCGMVEGQLAPVKILAGTTMVATAIVNNGTPFLAYRCIHLGHTVYVKPTIGYVLTEML